MALSEGGLALRPEPPPGGPPRGGAIPAATPTGAAPAVPPSPAGPVPGPRRWRRRGRRALSPLVGVGLFALSLLVLHRWARRISLEDLAAELARLGAGEVGLALLFTALSFVALAGYEFYAVRHVGRRVPAGAVALYSFITQSVAHAIGFAIVVGAAIRYKLYRPAGFTLFDVARIQVFFTTTFGLGAATLFGAVLLVEPGPLVAALGGPPALWRGAGALMLVLVAVVIAVGSVRRRPLPILGREVALPGPRVTLIQVGLGVADLLAVAAALHALMPDGLGITYAELLGIFAAAITVGLVSHVPGSLGVFESTVILLVRPTEDLTAPLIGALVAFRAVYYMLPLVLGAGAFGAVEFRRWLRPGPGREGRRRGVAGMPPP